MNAATQTAPCLILIPTKEQVLDLKVGDLAIDAFGRMSKVVEIGARSVDYKGRFFVVYYTETTANGSMSMAMKVGELVRHAGTSRHYTSAQLDKLARELGGF
jgi:hypothetical protein